MNKSIFIGVAIVVVAAAILSYTFLFAKAPIATAPGLSQQTSADTAATSTAESRDAGDKTLPSTSGPTFTASDVATHASAKSCYTIISGSVYDLTTWVGRHPGGEQAILSICGKDGTEAFINQHRGGKRQADILATFKIGTLAQ